MKVRLKEARGWPRELTSNRLLRRSVPQHTKQQRRVAHTIEGRVGRHVVSHIPFRDWRHCVAGRVMGRRHQMRPLHAEEHPLGCVVFFAACREMQHRCWSRSTAEQIWFSHFLSRGREPWTRERLRSLRYGWTHLAQLRQPHRVARSFGTFAFCPLFPCVLCNFIYKDVVVPRNRSMEMKRVAK